MGERIKELSAFMKEHKDLREELWLVPIIAVLVLVAALYGPG
jgi:hypothetical protein